MPKICSVEGCSNPVGKHGARGMCPNHYQLWRRNGDATVKKVVERPPVCIVPGCGRKHCCQGYCSMHYGRLRGSGDINQEVKKYIAKYPGEYQVFIGMKQRCYNPKNTGYKNYGGRGIKVCDRWLERFYGFKNFIDDMGPRPKGKYPNGFARYSIDRIDVDGDYTPENCRWVDRYKQSQNTRMGRRGASSVFGVYQVQNKQGKKYWVATMGVDGKTIWRWAESEEDAIMKRGELEKEYLRKPDNI